MDQVIEQVVALARVAGSKILEVYNSDFSVSFKEDESPLTQADLLAHELICGGLQLMAADIPILSEESTPGELSNRLCWSRYWLVDPLDGTKEFVSRNGEFTVNIALIENGVPVMGVVYAPTLELMYWGSDGGAFKQQGQQPPERIKVAATPGKNDCWRVVASRTHLNEATRQYLSQFNNPVIKTMGSSLKFCLIAEGSADVYPRLAPTSEWDSAAAQAIVEAAGGCVLEYPKLSVLRYNRRNTLLNPNFIVCAETPLCWV
ncbi:MAG: 3'(2'),5'-bisphosphate nucleotidase CysQ [Oceanospirillaceae bacterium]